MTDRESTKRDAEPSRSRRASKESGLTKLGVVLALGLSLGVVAIFANPFGSGGGSPGAQAKEHEDSSPTVVATRTHVSGTKTAQATQTHASGTKTVQATKTVGTTKTAGVTQTPPAATNTPVPTATHTAVPTETQTTVVRTATSTPPVIIHSATPTTVPPTRTPSVAKPTSTRTAAPPVGAVSPAAVAPAPRAVLMLPNTGVGAMNSPAAHMVYGLLMILGAVGALALLYGLRKRHA